MNIIKKIVKSILGERRFESDRRVKKRGYKKSNRRSARRREKWLGYIYHTLYSYFLSMTYWEVWVGD